MNDVTNINPADASPPDGGAFVVDGRRYDVPERELAASEMAKRAAVADGAALVRIDPGGARLVEPADLIALDGGVVPELRSGVGGRIWQLFVDGVPWDWPAPALMEEEVRSVAGAAEDDAVYHAGATAPVRAGGLVDLTLDFPPRLFLRPEVVVRDLAPGPERQPVPVIVNGRPRNLIEREVTYEDLVQLAFPQLPVDQRRAFTVTYRRGAPERPEGSLVARQAARLAPGAVVNVCATDRS